MTQSDKGLAKIAQGASPRRHAETSPVKVKDTHLMNNKLPPAEILCGDWEIYILTSMITWVDYIGMCVLRKIFMWEKFALRVSRD